MESSVVTDRNQVPYSAQFPNENMRKDCSTRIYTKGKNTCTNLHKIQFHCRSQLRLQQRLNSEERKCTCKQPLALHNPKALHMTPATSQHPTGTAHSEGGRLQRSRFSLDTTKKILRQRNVTILPKLSWRLSILTDFSTKHAFCKHILQNEQVIEGIWCH